MRGVFLVDGDDWLGLTVPVWSARSTDWCEADCATVVLFSGTVRDHAEAAPTCRLETRHTTMVVPKLAQSRRGRARKPMIGRLVPVHRAGSLRLCESSVIAVSAPHRAGVRRRLVAIDAGLRSRVEARGLPMAPGGPMPELIDAADVAPAEVR
jgi:hypothetical protein